MSRPPAILMCLPAGAEGGAPALVRSLEVAQIDLGARVRSAAIGRAEVRIDDCVTGSAEAYQAAQGGRLRLAFLLARYIRLSKIDVVHAHLSAYDVAAVAARIAGVPSLRTIHGRISRPGMLVPRERIGTLVCTKLLDQRLVAVSSDVAAEIQRHYPVVPGRDLFTIPNGCVVREDATHRDDDSSRPLRFVFVGRFEPEKGFRELIDAFTEVHASGARAELTLIGDGAMRDIVPRALIAAGAIKLSEGWLPSHAVRQIVSQRDVFVLPSWSEGLSIALLEAMADGLVPIVSAAANGDDVVGRENGLVFPTHSTHELLDCLRWLIEHPDQRPRMAHRARQTIIDRFDIRRTAAAYIDLYRTLEAKV